MTQAELDAAFRAAGAVTWGLLSYPQLTPHMNEWARHKTEELLPNPASLFVAALPYFTGQTEGNLSVYARGDDYHRVLHEKLNTVCDFLKENYPSYSFLAGADTSPLPERQAAWLCGLGVQGENGMFICPPYGSYVFLGTILTDAPLEAPEAQPAPRCMACGRCRAACPTKALEGRGACLSDLTQRKGVLTAEEEALLAAHPYVWGCDLCQTACPYNGDPTVQPLPEFTHDYLPSLTREMLAGMTNKAFAQAFGHRAFAWRGVAVLRRNLDLEHQ